VFDVGRREFIALLGSAATWPFGAHAQQPMPVIGLLRITSADPFGHVVDLCAQGLKDEGFAEGQNLSIEQRWADDRLDRWFRRVFGHPQRQLFERFTLGVLLDEVLPTPTSECI
jgi:hypothetical protein